ncbi:hypothetical protein [Streptomyces sp. NPDC051016]|uniref:hypothetical protein n=1 Tax=Streptomyces sp. NPDC051016 TaxID=3365638 RepID=UPI0037BB30EC
MNEFWVGVVSSVLASAALASLGWVVSPGARLKAKRVVLKSVNAEIVETFATQRDAATEISARLTGAREVRILAGRGNELQRDSFRGLWAEADRKELKILLPDPEVSGPGSWIDDHQQEALGYDGGQGDQMIAENIRNNVQYVRNRIARLDRSEIGLYDLPIIARLVITEKWAFITPYSNRRHGEDSPCIMVAAGNPVYELAERMFAQFQKASRIL